MTARATETENGIYPGFGVLERWQCWKPAYNTSLRRVVTKGVVAKGVVTKGVITKGVVTKGIFLKFRHSPKSDLALLTKQLHCFWCFL